MRDAFAAEITALAAADERIVLLVGDIGFRLWDEFREWFAGRFYNCGIAEQNMISVAAGLALAGMRPVVYTIASFATTRCLEQIRVDLCYHNLPVVIVGVGGGLSYAALGPTHHACEDIAMLRCLPNMTIVCPCDPIETKMALRASLAEPGPVYMRLGKRGEAELPCDKYFTIGKFRMMLQHPAIHQRVCILVTGPIAAVAVNVFWLLADQGVSAAVVSAHTVKPLDAEWLEAVDFELLVTIEEHSLIGGLSDSVNDCTSKRLLSFGTPDTFMHNVGNREQALEHCGLTAEKIAAKIMEALR